MLKGLILTACFVFSPVADAATYRLVSIESADCDGAACESIGEEAEVVRVTRTVTRTRLLRRRESRERLFFDRPIRMFRSVGCCR